MYFGFQGLRLRGYRQGQGRRQDESGIVMRKNQKLTSEKPRDNASVRNREKLDSADV